MKRRLFASALLALAACTSAAQAATYHMFRDPNCGCCKLWATHVREENDIEMAETITDDMAQVKLDNGVPRDLWSCHTMIVDGYVIEGHVPAQQIERLLTERPKGVRGLAVPGMPIGSPGMEMDNRTQPYEVIAFGTDENGAKRSVFARYD